MTSVASLVSWPFVGLSSNSWHICNRMQDGDSDTFWFLVRYKLLTYLPVFTRITQRGITAAGTTLGIVCHMWTPHNPEFIDHSDTEDDSLQATARLLDAWRAQTLGEYEPVVRADYIPVYEVYQLDDVRCVMAYWRQCNWSTTKHH